MEFGLTLFTSDRGIRPTTAAVAAERLGFSAFYVPEHTHIPVRRDAAHPGTGGAELPDERYCRTLDPWVALAAVSSVTSTRGVSAMSSTRKNASSRKVPNASSRAYKKGIINATTARTLP